MKFGPVVSEEMFENVDRRQTDEGQMPVISILIPHLGAFSSGELEINNTLCHNDQ